MSLRWIVPMESKIDYLQLHTGASFPLPFDILLIFSTNLQPDDLMDAAFLRRIRYKVKLHSPTSDEYRKIFEAVAKSHGLVLTDEIFEFVLENFANPSGKGRLTVAGRAEKQQAAPGAHCGQEFAEIIFRNDEALEAAP